MMILRMATSLLLIASCGAFEGAGRAIKATAGTIGGTLAEYTVCPLDLGIDCGHVFECYGTIAETPSGFVEVCIDDDDDPDQLDEIETLYGDCAPTPRHVGLCSYCCGPTCGRGCNAYSGCYCD